MTLFDKLFSRVYRSSEDPEVCWPWLGGTNDKGYGQIWWQGKMLLTHRVAFDECVDDIPEGMFVLHTCDNPPCCRPSHLFLGNQQSNLDDMIAKGRDAFPNLGKCNGRALLIDDDVRKIRELLSTTKLTSSEIGSMFGVTGVAIRHIKAGSTWKHVS
jgi:hypothetical protein